MASLRLGPIPPNPIYIYIYMYRTNMWHECTGPDRTSASYAATQLLCNNALILIAALSVVCGVTVRLDFSLA